MNHSTFPSRLLIASAILSASCSKVFLQDDGFETKLQAGCADEAACRRLQLEAEQRVIKCKDNTIGYVRCADAHADKVMADAFVTKYDDAKRQALEATQNANLERRQAEARVESERLERRREEERRQRERVVVEGFGR